MYANALARGFVDVGATRSAVADERLQAYVQKTRLGRLSQVEDVIGAIEFLVAARQRWSPAAIFLSDNEAVVQIEQSKTHHRSTIVIDRVDRRIASVARPMEWGLR